MDFSPLTEAQSQQFVAQTELIQREPQQQQQEAQQQEQQQLEQQPHQDVAYQPYDPSQLQSYEAYYAYAQHYNAHQQYYPHLQYYPYYPHDFSNADAAYQYQSQNLGHGAVPDPSQAVVAGEQTPQQNAYYPQDPQNSCEVPPGLEPAAASAVAALSQLTNFAGRMDAAERGMVGMQGQLWPVNNGSYGQMPGQPPFLHGAVGVHPNVGRPSYRGGGRRVGGPFRSGREGSGHHHPRSDTGAPPGRGRGRVGRGGGRRFQQHASAAEEQSYEPAPYQEPQSEDASTTEHTAALAPTQGRRRRAPQVAWCDLCNVDCNTQEILEQHKNGKRHKKNMQKLEEFQNRRRLLSESHQYATERSLNFQEGEEKNEGSTEELPKVATTTDENKVEMEQPTQMTEQSEVPTVGPTEATARKPRFDGSFENWRRPPKRKLQGKFGRGGKRMRQSEPMSRIEAPKEQPKYCALCHVTCDTQAVFECHLTGKRHASRVKRAKGPQGTYRAVGLHALYMPRAQQASSEVQSQHGSQLQVKKGIAEAGEHQAVPGGQDATTANAVCKSDGQGDLAIDGTVPITENAIMGVEHAFRTTEDVVVDPGYGVESTDHVPGPGQ